MGTRGRGANLGCTQHPCYCPGVRLRGHFLLVPPQPQLLLGRHPAPANQGWGRRDERLTGKGWLGFRASRVSNDSREVLPSAGGPRPQAGRVQGTRAGPPRCAEGRQCHPPPGLVTLATEPRAGKGLSAEWVPCPTGARGTNLHCEHHTHQLGPQLCDVASRREAHAAPDGGAGPPSQRTPFPIEISPE